MIKSVLLKALTLTIILCLVSGCAESKTASKKEDKKELITVNETAEHTLMSFNIRNTNSKDYGNQMWFYRKDKLAEYLLNNDAQVICMQEVKKEQYTFLKTALESKYEVIYFARESGGNPEGLAVAYDKSVFKAIDQKVFWFSDTPEEQSKGWGANYFRICVNVLLEDLKTGGKLNIFNVHLDSSSVESRNKSAALLIGKVKESPYPCAVMGDFNDKINSECLNIFNANMTDCQQAAPDTDNGITYNNWGKIADNKTTPIDFCFVSRDTVTPQSFKICRDKWDEVNYYSDHYAIKTKITANYTVTKYAD